MSAALRLLAAVAAAGMLVCGPGLEEGRPDQGRDVSVHDGPSVERGDQGWRCREFFASTYDHVVEGRAHVCGGYACANGSGENLGLYNTFNKVHLREVDKGYFEMGRCP